MVQVPHLGLLTTVLCVVFVAVTVARPLQYAYRSPSRHYHHHRRAPVASSAPAGRFDASRLPTANYLAARGGTETALRPSSSSSPPPPGDTAAAFEDLDDDGSVRSERSTNLSQIMGSRRPIQMNINAWQLQILPDGAVNGTDDDSDYTILYRSSVNNGQVRIQSLATCFFLCMDSCGLLYGSEAATEECVFSEVIEQPNYNTYASAKYSRGGRSMYVALNKHGQPRKAILKKGRAFGHLARAAFVLPRRVDEVRVRELLRRKAAARARVAAGPSGSEDQHAVRHLASVACPHHGARAPTPAPPDDSGRDKERCRGRRKRGKTGKKQKCPEGEECAEESTTVTVRAPARKPARARGTCREGETPAQCRRRLKEERRQERGKTRPNRRGAAKDEKKSKKKPQQQQQQQQQKRPTAAANKRLKEKLVVRSESERVEDKESGARRDGARQNQREAEGRGESVEVRREVQGGDAVTMTHAAARPESTAAAGTTTTSQTATMSTAATSSHDGSEVSAASVAPTSPKTSASASPALGASKAERSVQPGETSPGSAQEARSISTTPAPSFASPKASAAGSGAPATDTGAPEFSRPLVTGAAKPFDEGGASGVAPPAPADY